MARTCDECGRRSLRGMSRSHSNVATIRRQHLNLQRKRIGGVRRLVCTSCWKTMNRSRASRAKS